MHSLLNPFGFSLQRINETERLIYLISRQFHWQIPVVLNDAPSYPITVTGGADGMTTVSVCT